MLRVICLILAASAAVPPFTYRLPSPIFKTYATTNPHGKSPSSLSPETFTLETFIESFDDTTVESPADFIEKTTVRKTELALEDATNLTLDPIGLFSEFETARNLATLRPSDTSFDTTKASTSSQFSKENTDIDFVRINKRKRRRRSSTDPGAESFYTRFSTPLIPAMTSTSDPVTSATQPQITTTAADPAITVAEAVQLASASLIFADKKK
jgi:hypothetical protein